MVNFKLLVQQVGIASVSNFLATFSALILIPILTKSLSINNFGSWAVFAATIGLIPMIANLGLQNAMIRFLAVLRQKADIQEGFYTMLVLVVVTSAIASGVFFLFANQIAAIFFNNELSVALLLPINIFFACLISFIINYFRTFQQIRTYSALLLAQAYLQLAFVSFFVLSSHTLLGALTGFLIAQLLLFFIMASIIMWQIGIAFPKFRNSREYVRFGLPLVPYSLSNWITNSSDVYLIGLLLSTAAVGYYSPAYSLGRCITMFSMPFLAVFPGLLSKSYDEDSLSTVRLMLRYAWKYYLGVAIPSTFVISVLSKPILIIISTPAIAANGYLVTPLVATGALFLGAYEIPGAVIWLKKKTNFYAVTWGICAVVNFCLTLALIPFLGILGAALATLVAFVMVFVITVVYSYQLFELDFEGAFILKSLFASGVIALILLFLNPAGLINVLLSIGLAAAAYLLILFALKGFTSQEINFFYGILRGPR